MARLISSSRALYILEGVDTLAEKIRHASEELQTLRDVKAIASPAFDKPKVSGSRNDDAMVNRLSAIERYESELLRNVERWIERQKEADKLIASLDDARQMQALHMRYVEGHSVAYIADAMFYSRKQVYEIIHKALDALDDVLEARANVEERNENEIRRKAKGKRNEHRTKRGDYGACESLICGFGSNAERDADNEREDFIS